MDLDPESILEFWFEELTPEDWFKKDDRLDEMIRRRFLPIHRLAERGELFLWRIIPRGRLAEILLLDQFTRNIYRGTPDAFRNDHAALALSQEVVLLGLDKKMSQEERRFIYMPFMHSESKLVHEVALNLFQELGEKDALKFEQLHKNIIDKFGRFPHRNRILGRSTTIDEHKFLQHDRGF